MTDEAPPKCVWLREDDGVLVVPIKPGRDPLKDGFFESIDWPKRTRVPLQLNVPTPGGPLEDEIKDSKGAPIVC